MKKVCKFAAYNISKGGLICLYAAGIFYAPLQIHGVTPVWCVNASTALAVLYNGSVAPFFHATTTNIFSEMYNTEKSLQGASMPQANRLTHDTGIQLFSFEGTKKVRVLTVNGEPWFVAADVCRVLQFKNPSMVTASLGEEERAKLNLGRQGKTWAISEAGLYFLMLRCRDAVNKGTVPYRFRKWVTSEVLPAIRKTGQYNPNTYIKQLETETHLLRLNVERWRGIARRIHKEQEAGTVAEHYKEQLFLAADNMFTSYPIGQVTDVFSDIIYYATHPGTLFELDQEAQIEIQTRFNQILAYVAKIYDAYQDCDDTRKTK